MDRRLISNSELSGCEHFLNNFRSDNDIMLWISSSEIVSSTASICITLIRLKHVFHDCFIPILFSLSIFVNFHDNLTSNYTKLQFKLSCIHSKTFIYPFRLLGPFFFNEILLKCDSFTASTRHLRVQFSVI